jgi:hypothetical protein
VGQKLAEEPKWKWLGRRCDQRNAQFERRRVHGIRVLRLVAVRVENRCSIAAGAMAPAALRKPIVPGLIAELAMVVLFLEER